MFNSTLAYLMIAVMIIFNEGAIFKSSVLQSEKEDYKPKHKLGINNKASGVPKTVEKPRKTKKNLTRRKERKSI